MATPIVINKFGRLQGWNSITTTILGRDLEGITAVNYSDTQSKENVYGAGKFPVGRGEGNYEASASITLIKEEVDALRKSLPPSTRIQDIPPFDIEVKYELPSGEIYKDRIRNAEFTNSVREVAQGDGSIASEFELIISHIDWNVVI